MKLSQKPQAVHKGLCRQQGSGHFLPSAPLCQGCWGRGTSSLPHAQCHCALADCMLGNSLGAGDYSSAAPSGYIFCPPLSTGTGLVLLSQLGGLTEAKDKEARRCTRGSRQAPGERNPPDSPCSPEVSGGLGLHHRPLQSPATPPPPAPAQLPCFTGGQPDSQIRSTHHHLCPKYLGHFLSRSFLFKYVVHRGLP